MTYFYLILFTFLLALFNSEMDTIKHRPNQTWINKKFAKKLFKKNYEKVKKWYLSNNWRGHSWVRKTLFSFTLDGWHLMKSAMVYSLSVISMISVCLELGININWSLLLSIISYVIVGSLFEIFYQDYLGV